MQKNRLSIYLDTLLQHLPQEVKSPVEEYKELIQLAREIAGITEGKLETDLPLISILSQIKDPDPKPPEYYYWPEQLEIKSIDEASVFPDKKQENKLPDTSVADQKLTKELEIRLKEATSSISDPKALSYTIYHLLHAYTARLTAHPHGAPVDVSLFDHNRVLAGIVTCLTHPDVSQNGAEKFLLIKAGIPSIQKFIYSGIDISQAGGGDKLSKKLRGRSFYVNLLTNFLADTFVKELNLMEANLIFATGGHFLLLSPSYDGIIDKIDKLSKDLNLELNQQVGVRLGLLTAHTEVERKELFKDSGTYIGKVSQELDEILKYKKHYGYLEEIFYAKMQEPVNDQFQDDLWLGTNIPYSDYLIELDLVDSDEAREEFEIIQGYSTSEGFFRHRGGESYVAKFLARNKVYLMPRSRKDANPEEEKSLTDIRAEIQKVLSKYKQHINSARLILLNRTNTYDFFDLSQSFDFPIGFGFRFLGNECRQFFEEPTTENQPGDVLTFEELQKLDYAKKGLGKFKDRQLSYPFMGVIRLDVDYLGGIFKHGLGEKASFMRLATLSRELDMFFSGYMNTLANEYQLYTTYSGGDDAFLVGSWYNVVHFAEKLYEKFRIFACKNEHLSFSAGIFFCDSHYPVAKFAEDADELQDQAKRFDKKVRTEAGTEIQVVKNAVNVFDHTLSWESYSGMLRFAEKLLTYTESEENEEIENPQKLARSLVHRLLRIIKSSVKPNGRVDVRIMSRNLAQLYYLFARHGFKKEQVEDKTNALAKEIIKVILCEFGKDDLVKNYLIPTSYVLWKTRELNN